MTSRMLAHAALIALVSAAALRFLIAILETQAGNGIRPLRLLAKASEIPTLALGAVFILASRAPTWAARVVINPDEAQMAANALLVRAGRWTWSGLDGTTNGPPNAIVLAWPYLGGMDVTLSTTRLTSTVVLLLILLFTYAALRQALPARSALFCVLPAVLFVGGTLHDDFLHYSSEQTPLALLMAGACGCMRPFASWRPSRRFVPYLAAVSVGMVPLAKLQAAPLALVVLAGLIARALALPAGQRVPATSRVLICAALPGALFLLPLLPGGNLRHFTDGYLRWAMTYIGTLGAPLTGSELVEIVTQDPAFRGLTLCVTAAASVWLVLCLVRRRSIDGETAWVCAFSLILFAAACWAVVKPGRPYPHYLFLLMPPGTLATGGLLAIARRSTRDSRLLGLFPEAILLAATLWFVWPTVSHSARNNPYGRGVDAGFRTRSPSVLSWLGPTSSDALLVWGWMPGWYLDAGIRPATRETHTEAHIRPSAMRDYFRQRLLDDLDRSRPAFVLDAVAPGSFAFEDAETQSVTSFPALASVIAADFVRISDPQSGSRCPRLYVRRERWHAVSTRLVAIARATATAVHPDPSRHVGPERLIDNGLMETCDSFWLLPDGSTGSAVVEFGERTRVGQVWVLNTANGRLRDRAAGRVRLNALRGQQTVHEHEANLAAYPEWTVVDFPASDIDAIRIDVLSYEGRGGGLNEIKVFRE